MLCTCLCTDVIFRFPKQPKDAITNTLNAIAARVGDSNATKRWRLLAAS